MTRKLLFVLTLVAWPVLSRAQFFDFGFGDDPFMQRRQQVQQQKYTAPEFKGGDKAVQAFVQKNFKNPPVENREREGVVVVACIVNEKGKVEKRNVNTSAFVKERVDDNYMVMHVVVPQSVTNDACRFAPKASVW